MPSQTSEAYVWLWLPGSAEPAVAGMVQRSRTRYRFTYAPSYLARHDAISLYQPELPLRPGWIEPLGGLTIAGTLRDAGPDAWGQRVIIQGLFGNPDAVDPGDVDQVTYFLSSASNRIGALDFQESAVTYVERGGSATLDELHGAARNLADGHDLTPEMATALVHGTSVGGARPKVTITDGDMAYIAKLSRSTDPYPVVKAEAVGLELARRVGIDAPKWRRFERLGVTWRTRTASPQPSAPTCSADRSSIRQPSTDCPRPRAPADRSSRHRCEGNQTEASPRLNHAVHMGRLAKTLGSFTDDARDQAGSRMTTGITRLVLAS